MESTQEQPVFRALQQKMRRIKELGFRYEPIIFDSRIIVVCGAFCLHLHESGLTVAELRSVHGDILALTAGSYPLVNGKSVAEDATVVPGDLLEFVLA